jgi:hypothetical protein
MKGQIAILKLEVERNNMGYNVFDFFKDALSKYTTSTRAGWYAYILRDGVYYFLWTDYKKLPSKKYLDLLKKDGYILAFPIHHQTISDTFS